jgi:hypothetical protein
MAAATDCGLEILPHPKLSPNLAPSDFYVFPKLKPSFMVDILEAMKVPWRRSMSFLRIESSILEGFNKLVHRWVKCIDVEGDLIY